MRTALSLLATAALSGCGQPVVDNAAAPAGNQAVEVEDIAADDGALPATGETGTEIAAGTDAWVGKWVGPEGLALDVAPAAEPGGYRLTVTLLDGTDSYDGTVDGDVIRFTRDGVEETIRRANGDETGLKYLAGKQDCVVIKPGEGFCRG